MMTTLRVSSFIGVNTKRQPPGLKAKVEGQKLQFFQQPLEAGSKIESIPIEPNVKININTFTAWYKKRFWSL